MIRSTAPFLRLSQLRKTHKALWYLKTEGHMARFAVGHTAEIAARHYADIPSLRPLHEQTVADALEEALLVQGSSSSRRGSGCAASWQAPIR
jgi:intergrase/recombinase